MRCPRGKSRLVEILHIDTHNSRSLYTSLRLNSQEKARAQTLLKRAFINACSKNKGIFRDWAGDGGFAFFLSEKDFGLSVKAAGAFLEDLRNINAQTALALNISSFLRSVRIKAHRGEIFLTGDSSLDSADSKDFDDFLKYEKRFAPEPDEFFITDSLYKVLSVQMKELFDNYGKVKAGSIKSTIFRQKATPTPRVDNIFSYGEELSKIKMDDWNYLKSHIISQKKNVAAHNEITKGLIRRIEESADKRHLIRSKDLFELTLTALYNYLRTCFEPYKFRISFWQKVVNDGKEYLALAYYQYPKDEKPGKISRKISIDKQQFQVCRAFRQEEALATPSVVAARLAEKWFDFEHSQKTKKRHLASALQVPVYYRNRNNKKFMQGVLCIDSDKPDMFLQEEIDLWKEELVNYLSNLSLGEQLRQNGA